MMTEEEFMDIRQMHAEGMTYVEIAVETGYQRSTISDRIRNGGPLPNAAPTPTGC